MPQPPVSAPARYAPIFAVGYSAESGALNPVSSGAPLPVSLSSGPLATPLAGTANANVLAGPFVPTPGTPVTVVLDGTWSGEVAVRRSLDSGVTLHGLTVGSASWARFSANACEPVWEEADPAASLYLDITVTSGTLSYRLGH